MIRITADVELADCEIEITAIRASGSGGQNVNKVSSAIHLQFDIKRSNLPDFCKERLLQISDHRISKDGVIVIKARKFRTQEKNKADAVKRLKDLIGSALMKVKKRKPTKSTRSSQQRRMDKKTQRGKTKVLRSKIDL